MEVEKGKLMQYLNVLCDAEQGDTAGSGKPFQDALTEVYAQAKQHSTKMGRIFCHPVFPLHLLDLKKWGDHFLQTVAFNLTVHVRDIISVHGGLLANLTENGSKRLDDLLVAVDASFVPIIGGPDLLQDHEAMMAFVKLGRGEEREAWERKTGLSWVGYVRSIIDAVTHAPRAHRQLNREAFVSSRFLDLVDGSYNELITDKDIIGLGTKRYRDDLHNYIQCCVAHATNVFNLDVDPSELSVIDRQFRSKLLILWLGPGELEPGEPALPLLTKSFWQDIHKGFGKYPNAIKEIARWFEPLVDFNVLTMRVRTSFDYSLTALCTLNLNKSVLDHRQAQDAFVLCLFRGLHCDMRALEIELAKFPARAATSDTYKNCFYFTEKSSLPADNIVTRAIDNSAEVQEQIADIMLKNVTPSYSAGRTSYIRKLSSIAAATPLTGSYIDLPGIPPGSRKREYKRITQVTMFEHCLVREYRVPLLQTQANRFRHHLGSALEHCVLRSFYIEKEGVKHIKYSDGLYNPIALLDDPVRNGRVAASNTIEAINVQSIKDIISEIVNAPSAQLYGDCVNQGEKPLAHEVASAADELVEALELNSARNVHRAVHGPNEPFFIDDPRKDFRFVIPKGVRDPNTYEKQPSQNATKKLGEKAKARTGSKQAQQNFDQQARGKAKVEGKEKNRAVLRSAEVMEDSDDEELSSGLDEETRLYDTIGEPSELSTASKKQQAKRKLKSPTYPFAVKRYKRSSTSDDNSADLPDSESDSDADESFVLSLL